MPSRWAKTGTRASACTRATRLLPPRGTITSIAPSRPAQHGPHGGAVAGGNELDARLGQARFLEPGGEAGMDQPRGMKTLRAGAQNGGVAGLEAKPAGVGGDIGPAFENHPDHAERRRDALDAQAVGALERLQQPADGIRQVGDLFKTAGDGGDALVVEHQAVEQRRPRDSSPAHWPCRAHWPRAAPACGRAEFWRRRAGRNSSAPATTSASTRAALRASRPIASMTVSRSAAPPSTTFRLSIAFRPGVFIKLKLGIEI